MPLFDHIDSFADAPCLVTEKTCLTFAEVASRADTLYGSLPQVAQGLVFLQAYTSVDAIIAYVGAVRRGYAVHLLDPGKPAENARLTDIYAPDLIVDVKADNPLKHLGDGEGIHPDIAILLSTSGSTGAAKLVKLTHRNIASNTDAICEYLELSPRDRGVTNLKLFYSYGMSVVNTHLAAGASLLVTSLGTDDPRYWELVAHHSVTNVAGVPFTFEKLRESGFDPHSVPSLRLMTQAGGKLAPHTVRHFADLGARCGVDFCVMYGQTEAGPRMSYLPAAMARDAPNAIGQAIPGGELYIVDPSGQRITDPGVSGELVYEGPNVMAGYAESRADLAHLETLSALYTGDIAHFDDRGLFYIDGRASRFVKPFGLRLSLDDIEQAVGAEHGLVAVTGTDTRIVIAVAKPISDPGALASTLARRYGVPPALFEVIGGKPFPRLANGKIDYRSLLVEYGDDAAPAPLAQVFINCFFGILSGRTRCPASVFEAFRSVMGTRIQNPDQSFRAAGGDSLSYMQVLMLLEEYLGAVPRDWAERSIADLEHLKGASLA